MSRRPVLAVAGWLAAAVVALLVGLGAIRLVGESITGTPGGVRSQDEVLRALASPVPSGPTVAVTAPPTTGAPTATPAGTDARRFFATTGGTAVAECTPSGVWLVSWAPAPGWRVHEVERGPDERVEVRFTGPGGEDELKVRCAGDPARPQRHD
ncbi:septum formation initiator [Micromonospora sp. NPDC092111]|uniref:septum formation initiator n=1 Tax=Micromonospora sp. NPDC092111 TaxID=3364289 RepID=UPI00381A588D